MARAEAARMGYRIHALFVSFGTYLTHAEVEGHGQLPHCHRSKLHSAAKYFCYPRGTKSESCKCCKCELLIVIFLKMHLKH